jgi:hypothetical protein
MMNLRKPFTLTINLDTTSIRSTADLEEAIHLAAKAVNDGEEAVEGFLYDKDDKEVGSWSIDDNIHL